MKEIIKKLKIDIESNKKDANIGLDICILDSKEAQKIIDFVSFVVSTRKSQSAFLKAKTLKEFNDLMKQCKQNEKELDKLLEDCE